MDSSVFDSILDVLDAYGSSLALRLHIFTGFVIVGVAFELLFIWLDHHDEWKKWIIATTRAMIPFPERPGRLKLFAELLSVGFVVFGVWGELTVDILSARLETARREINQLHILVLEAEAGDAAANAERAQNSVKGLTAKADTLDQQLTADEQRVARLKGDVVSRRVLLSEAEPELTRRFSSFPGQAFWMFGGVASSKESRDEESREVGQKLESILSAKAHWKGTWFSGGGGRVGFVPTDCIRFWDNAIFVFVSSKAPPSTKKAADTLRAALSSVLSVNLEVPQQITLDVIQEDDPNGCAPVRGVKQNPSILAIVIGARKERW